MPDVRNLQLFVVAALVLAITPGPAVLYIVTRSITQAVSYTHLTLPTNREV